MLGGRASKIHHTGPIIPKTMRTSQSRPGMYLVCSPGYPLFVTWKRESSDTIRETFFLPYSYSSKLVEDEVLIAPSSR